MDPTSNGEGFALLIVCDATKVEAAVIGDLARWCIQHGLFSVSTWGPSCERVHDLFDQGDVALMLTLEEPARAESGVVMSTWHDKETLASAVEYFWTCTIAHEAKAWGPAWIVLVIGSEAWADEVRLLAATELLGL